jgi:hypothetical protein
MTSYYFLNEGNMLWCGDSLQNASDYLVQHRKNISPELDWSEEVGFNLYERDLSLVIIGDKIYKKVARVNTKKKIDVTATVIH